MQLVSQSPSAGSRAHKPRQQPARFGKVAAFLSVVALIILSYVGGSAAMYFGLPTSSYLSKAFAEGRLWASRETPPAVVSSNDLAQSTVTIDLAEETFDGYTLFTSSQAAEATLLDMRGRVVHQWKVPPEKWPGREHIGNKGADSLIHCERCFVYPNGDLLVLYGGPNSPYGEGLAKFDKDSRFLWGYSASVHHDFDVGEDGRIYVLTQMIGVKAPHGLDSIPSDYTADYLVVLSPEGKELETVPLLEAFRDSPYFLAFLSDVENEPTSSLPGLMPLHPPGPPPGQPQPDGPFPPPGMPHLSGGMPPPGMGQPPRTGTFGRGDIFHTNSVKVLGQALAPRYPLFKPGQVLLSLRSPSLLAVLDIPRRSVVWAARGPWKSQHDARFLENGHLLLFDNQGPARGSRVLEYDPVTQALPWSYTGTGSLKTWSPYRGMSQRLPNENTLVVNPEELQVLEVTKGQKIVWQWGCAQPSGKSGGALAGTEPLCITGAKRFGPQELTFLKGKPGVQPR
jgi:hypothetical protein